MLTIRHSDSYLLVIRGDGEVLDLGMVCLVAADLGPGGRVPAHHHGPHPQASRLSCGKVLPAVGEGDAGDGMPEGIDEEDMDVQDDSAPVAHVQVLLPRLDIPHHQGGAEGEDHA